MKLFDQDSINKFNQYVADNNLKQTGILGNQDEVTLHLDNGTTAVIQANLMPLVNIPEGKYNSILYGKNSLENIVGAECDGEQLYLFIQNGQKVETKLITNRLWVLAHKNFDGKFSQLGGNRPYKWVKYYKDAEKWAETNKVKKMYDLYKSYCPIEANFISRGFTFFKGMQIKNVSVLSFDIETSGIVKNDKSDVYLISNTYRCGDVVETKLFDFHDYPDRKAMLIDWCKWVREKDPSLMIGHNVYMYDLPYLQHVAAMNDCTLDLGRDGSNLKISNWPSKFRKDGNEKIEYFKSKIFGREIIDTFFLSFKYDIGRKYISNGLKQIIKQEGLEKEGRTFVDASKIRDYTNDKEMWPKICQYAIEDSDDALKIFDLMAPAFFYSAQLIPKKFEDIINGASGSQLNSIMVRAYLQDNQSVAKASEIVQFQGAISNAKPGIYHNCVRWDVVSLYPSIMKQFNIFSPSKDPQNYLLQTLFTILEKRLYHKAEFQKTNIKFHDDMQAALKILANSYYGFLGAPGLNYNYPQGAALITQKGREILSKAIKWASNKQPEEIFTMTQYEPKAEDNE